MSMRFKDWMLRYVFPAMERLGGIDPAFFGQRDIRCMVAAIVHIESKSKKDDKPTALAKVNHNLAGVKFVPSVDEGRYDMVTYPANEFDKEETVGYRAYDSYEHSLMNIRWHLLFSSYYVNLRQSSCDDWLRAIGPIWCPYNPKHTETLVRLYWEWEAASIVSQRPS